MEEITIQKEIRMDNTTGVNKTSKFLLKKEIKETVINEYRAVG